jgi:hypothetical protein
LFLQEQIKDIIIINRLEFLLLLLLLLLLSLLLLFLLLLLLRRKCHVPVAHATKGAL